MYASYDQDVTLVVTPMEHPTNPRGELAFGGPTVCWGKHRPSGDFHIYANPIEFLMAIRSSPKPGRDTSMLLVKARGVDRYL